LTLESRILEEAEYEAWDRFVTACPTGSVYSCTKYLDVLARMTECRFRVMALIANGQYVGGVALFERPTRWGRILEPRLLMQYNGLVLAHAESKYPSQRASNTIKITDEVAAFIESQKYAKTLLKCRWPFVDVRAFTQRGWLATPSYTYIVPLSDLERQWDLVDRNLKRLIRRCERDGLAVTVDDDFESFFRMHEETHQRKGAPIYLSKIKFADYFKELHANGLARLYHARLPDGASIASQLVLAGDHPVCETVSACADGRHLKTGSNAFLRWKAFKHLAADGYTHNDLTVASLNSVTRFKSQFGGDLRLCFVLSYPSSRRYRWGSRMMSPVRALLRR
jgi:hypothetical protein